MSPLVEAIRAQRGAQSRAIAAFVGWTALLMTALAAVLS